MGLVTKPKNVQVKEFNQGGVFHTHQREDPMNLGRSPIHKDLKIRRQRLTVNDTLRSGGMKLIKEVLEVPTTQSDVGHVTILVTLFLISIQ